MEKGLGKGEKHAWGKKALGTGYELGEGRDVCALLFLYRQHLGTCRCSIDTDELIAWKEVIKYKKGWAIANDIEDVSGSRKLDHEG